MQRGMSLIGVILLLAVLGFVAVIGFRLAPVYLEYFAIKRALTNTVNSPEGKTASFMDLRRAFDRRAEVDNIRAVRSSDLEIGKEDGATVMRARYSARVPLFANVAACIDFEASSSPAGR